VEELIDYVLRSTRVYRVGPRVRKEGRIVTVDDFPPVPAEGESEGEEIIDLFFVKVGFTEAVEARTATEFYDLVVSAAEKGAGAMNVSVLRGGPSYIALGGWLGDQTLAFQYLALGAYHGLWDVVTPSTLGITGSAAMDIAGRGMVMASGLRDPDVQDAV
jgi:hypothetical protein